MLALKSVSLLGLLLIGAMFGFFYAWVCSTMWGLDAADPRVAIAAMQEMNASVRNAVFAPAMFGTPFVLALAAALARRCSKTAACLFAAAALTYLLFGAVLTFSVNVPMNEALALIAVPDTVEEARQIWQDYSPDWQFWNQMRTLACGVALLLTGLGLVLLPGRQGM
ncbi:MAG: anthrone oxygenase family protein [Pseudomonadota bacterium]